MTGAALDRMTGEIVARTFPYDTGAIAAWAKGFESPSAAYESGVTGFHLARELNAMGLPCEVAAVSKLPKSAVGKRKKNDRNDAIEIARAVSNGAIPAVAIPDADCEALRGLARTKRRLNTFLIRHGHIWGEKGPDGGRKGKWTRTHWAWMREIEFACEPDQDEDRGQRGQVHVRLVQVHR